MTYECTKHYKKHTLMQQDLFMLCWWVVRLVSEGPSTIFRLMLHFFLKASLTVLKLQNSKIPKHKLSFKFYWYVNFKRFECFQWKAISSIHSKVFSNFKLGNSITGWNAKERERAFGNSGTIRFFSNARLVGVGGRSCHGMFKWQVHLRFSLGPKLKA